MIWMCRRSCVARHKKRSHAARVKHSGGSGFSTLPLFYFCVRGARYTLQVSNTFKIRGEALRGIQKHAQLWPETEVCGLLAGKGGVTELALRTQNAAANPEIEYQIAPKELFAAMRAIRESGARLTGIYHSHPNGPARPSERDIAEAYYPEAAYVIATLHADGSVELRAYAIRDGAAAELEIVTEGKS
jgi:proteasome lid subunit RPN8/RPN11